ncbi:MAG: hypothetical protein Q8M08_02960 [Bacteroidales bacterium]|nr:hypothetical protein [Bacteroidales bacterium]
MPANKYALIRYRVINRCLKDFQFASMDKLIQVCEDALSMSPISERTIYQDLKDMREDDQLGYNAPIKLNRDKGYYYDDPDYSIDNIPLGKRKSKRCHLQPPCWTSSGTLVSFRPLPAPCKRSWKR